MMTTVEDTNLQICYLFATDVHHLSSRIRGFLASDRYTKLSWIFLNHLPLSSI